jgi:dTDP-4-dehydrorhamnose reductase
MARVSIIGSDGQLGFDLVREFAAAGHDVTAWTHADIEITDGLSIDRAFDGASPEIVVNTAALNVEASELDPPKAFAVNALGARELARAAATRGARLLSFSTDYVFDGLKGAEYVEDDQTAPLNVYGVSKLAGEQFVLEGSPDNLVIRSSGLYGENGCKAKKGLNFVTMMLGLAAERDTLSVVEDEALSPTFTRDLAKQTVAAEAGGATGVVHATAHGRASWFEFASAIFELSGVEIDVQPTTSAEFAKGSSNPIHRPADTSLENASLSAAGLEQMRPWREALDDYLTLIGRRA